MNKEQKVNYIKMWLQKFGNRDNETFNVEIKRNGDIIWFISLQFDYDEDGDRLEPYDWCRNGFKHMRNNTISDRTDDELDEIILNLKSIKTVY